MIRKENSCLYCLLKTENTAECEVFFDYQVSTYKLTITNIALCFIHGSFSYYFYNFNTIIIIYSMMYLLGKNTMILTCFIIMYIN